MLAWYSVTREWTNAGLDDDDVGDNGPSAVDADCITLVTWIGCLRTVMLPEVRTAVTVTGPERFMFFMAVQGVLWLLLGRWRYRPPFPGHRGSRSSFPGSKVKAVNKVTGPESLFP